MHGWRQTWFNKKSSLAVLLFFSIGLFCIPYLSRSLFTRLSQVGQVVICTSWVQEGRGLLKGRENSPVLEKAEKLIGSHAVTMVAGRSPHLNQMAYNYLHPTIPLLSWQLYYAIYIVFFKNILYTCYIYLHKCSYNKYNYIYFVCYILCCRIILLCKFIITQQPSCTSKMTFGY